jgi:hypothetical protein
VISDNIFWDMASLIWPYPLRFCENAALAETVTDATNIIYVDSSTNSWN